MEPAESAKGPVDFKQQIEPLLAAHCYQCHGADKQESGFRLNKKKEAFAGGDNGIAILPGNAAGSRLIEFVTSKDQDTLMPPPKAGKPLSAAQIDLLRRWIDQGAKWPDDQTAPQVEGHWAYTKPVRRDPPAVQNHAWPRNPIDQFVLAKLEAEGLAPSPELERPQLLRRVSLDLVGLPPTPAEVAAFVNDRSPDAYEKVVDRLLQSPHYGERWARPWLDLARYADTHGYEKDPGRTMWPYRDWVIDALNRDLPFEEFTIEQLAGDLLPGATASQKVATGFHRNTMINTEGGVDNEEYRIAALIDRVNTTATVWLGTTLGCCQCHSHKYDPFKQKEYYRFLAFFNNTADPGNSNGPELAVEPLSFPLDAAQTAQEIARLETDQRRVAQRVAAEQPKWEKAALAAAEANWIAVEATELKSAGGAQLATSSDGSIEVSGQNPPNDTYTITARIDLRGIAGLRLELWPDAQAPHHSLGRAADGAVALSRVELTVAPADNEKGAKPVALQRAVADYSQPGYPIQDLIDTSKTGGWRVDAEADGTRLPHAAVFEFADKVGFDQATRLTIRLINKTTAAEANPAHFRLFLTMGQKAGDHSLLPAPVRAALQEKPDARSVDQQQLLRDYYLATQPELRALREQIARLRTPSLNAAGAKVKTLVMQELPKPRATHVFLGGSFLAQGDLVTPGVPAVLPPLPEKAPLDRLTLAKWLVSPDNPLTARVAVNRAWEQLFGRGIVTTCEDFGTRCDPPSHPELLDWLATEYIRLGWSTKALHRLIVTSATYRQTSRVSPELVEKDPHNRWLARGPRVRLEAELIRDQALAVSGLLSPKIGGPSVMPPQPEGIWNRPYSGERWVVSPGEDRHRRGLYTYWRRTAPYPEFMSFDAPSREVCTVRRPRTNTPLQALTVLNDPVYVEAARALAGRIVGEASGDEPARAEYGFRLCLARAPTAAETARLVALYQEQRARFENDPAAAKKLLAGGPTMPNPAAAAAWTVVANVLMNLDEFLTK
ncbi:MAG TPA: PSD1 and planctomycete cytochrome C domain-containing protein [Pirellulales bacterium]|nr:PSD1 and planctomycete cytochrome C domain-containing protein [Pirellulales bacterium]